MAHECSECSFVPDAGTLLAFVVSREVRDRTGQKPEFVGKFTMPGWTGHSGFYVFKCPECDDVRIDYPHGYCENGCLYIYCDKCRFRIVFYPGRYRDVYKREQVVAPPTVWEILKYHWKNRKKFRKARRTNSDIEAVEAMGVRVVVPSDDDNDLF